MLNLFVFISFQTPLHLSAQKGHIETCRVLLQSNADVHARDKKCAPLSNPLDTVSRSCTHPQLKSTELILLFLFSQHTPLHYAALDGHHEVCRLLSLSLPGVASPIQTPAFYKHIDTPPQPQRENGPSAAARTARPLPDDEQLRQRAPRWAGDSSVVLGAERRGIPLEELTQRAPNRHTSRTRGDTSLSIGLKFQRQIIEGGDDL